MTPGAGDGTGDGHQQDEAEDRPELDVDSLFAEIVAGWSQASGPQVGRWPAQEDVDESAAAPVGDATAPEDDPDARPSGLDRRRTDVPAAGGREDVLDGGWSGPRDYREPEDEGFVPPEPPPLPRGDVVTRLAWAGVVGGPLVMLIAALAWKTLPGVLLMAAVIGFVAGFVVLVARLPGDREDDDDDGAVV